MALDAWNALTPLGYTTPPVIPATKNNVRSRLVIVRLHAGASNEPVRRAVMSRVLVLILPLLFIGCHRIERPIVTPALSALRRPRSPAGRLGRSARLRA